MVRTESSISRQSLSGFKKRKDEGRIVNIDEATLQALIALPDRNTSAGLRDYALFMTFLDCGIRPKEAFGHMESDFNSGAGELYVRSENYSTRTAI